MSTHKQKVIIATVYSFEPIISSVMKIGADKLYLLIDKVPDTTQSNAVKEIQKAVSTYVATEIVKTEVYNISDVARDAVKIIDKLPKTSQIFLNVSGARKTKSMALMFAGYARSDRIYQIIYVTKEDKSVIILPKLSFQLSKSEKEILLTFQDDKIADMRDRIFKTNISRAQFYKSLKELKSKGLIDDMNRITEAGKIAVL